MFKKIIAWLKKWLTESDYPLLGRNEVMVPTKNRGPLKKRYYKHVAHIGQNTKGGVPMEEEG